VDRRAQQRATRANRSVPDTATPAGNCGHTIPGLGNARGAILPGSSLRWRVVMTMERFI